MTLLVTSYKGFLTDDVKTIIIELTRKNPKLDLQSLTSIVGTDIHMSNLDIRLSNLDIRMSSLDIRMSKLILEFGKNKTDKNSKFLVGFRMFFPIFDTSHG